MEIDYFEQFFEDQKKKDGPRENHRWNNVETVKFLKGIATMMTETGCEYERPTARLFYEKLKQKYFTECKLSVNVLRSKMRHLKGSYFKAVEWKDNVGMELYESDLKHIHTRIKTICPYFNLLDDIFGKATNSDPIGYRLPEMSFDDETIFSDSTHNPAKRIKEDRATEGLIVPKQEAFYDEPSDFRDETYDTNNDEHESTTFQETRQSNTNIPKANATKPKRSASNISLEERKFQLEKQKFQVSYALQSRRITLEEKKLKFEREKFEKMQKMRKYEIDKQFAIKKQEIESNERLKRLAMGKNAEIVVNEIENTTYEPNATEEDDDDDEEEDEAVVDDEEPEERENDALTLEEEGQQTVVGNELAD